MLIINSTWKIVKQVFFGFKLIAVIPWGSINFAHILLIIVMFKIYNSSEEFSKWINTPRESITVLIGKLIFLAANSFLLEFNFK